MTATYLKKAAWLEQEMLNGRFGSSGSRFPQTREIASICEVSLVTAQQIMVTLREKGLITLCGKKYYLTCGRIAPATPLGQRKRENTHLLGGYIPHISNPFFSALSQALQQAARKAGYECLLVYANREEGMADEQNALMLLRKIGVMGVLSVPGYYPGVASLYQNYSLPYVFVGSRPENGKGCAVLADNRTAARNVALHFIKNGYRSFAYIGQKHLEPSEDDRLIGYREGLTAEGYTLSEKNMLRVDMTDRILLHRELWHFLSEQTLPVAVFCHQDLIAAELFTECRQMGLAIPDSVAIAGFDNLPITTFLEPQLTTVRYRIDDMAEKAVQLLVQAIETDTELSAGDYYLTSTLLARGSSIKKEKKEAEK